MTVRQELLEGLTAEQLQMVRDCDNIEDLLELAQDEGVELTEEQLSAVSGGCSQKKKDEDKDGENKRPRKIED